MAPDNGKLSDFLSNFAAYSVALIVAYNIIEALCFFGWDAYNWPCTLTFRIILHLHDFAYVITFAIYAAFNDQEIFPLKVSCCFFFLVTFGFNVATIFMYSKLPRSLCCGQMNSQSKPIFINMDGQTYQLKNLQNQAHTAQSSYVMQPVSAQAPMATIETDMSVATGQPPVVQTADNFDTVPTEKL